MSRTSSALYALAAVALALFVVAHFRTYGLVPASSSIIQTPVGSLTPALLCERQPVILQDRVLRPADLVASVFRWQVYPWCSSPGRGRAAPERCTARFTIVAPQRATTVEIALRNASDSASVSLAEGQVLILPPHWWFVASPDVRVLRLHDTTSLIGSAIARALLALRRDRDRAVGPQRGAQTASTENSPGDSHMPTTLPAEASTLA